MMSENKLTVTELKQILITLEEQGYGDDKVYFGYDSNSCYTSTSNEYYVEDDGIYFEEPDW